MILVGIPPRAKLVRGVYLQKQRELLVLSTAHWYRCDPPPLVKQQLSFLRNRGFLRCGFLRRGFLRCGLLRCSLILQRFLRGGLLRRGSVLQLRVTSAACSTD